SIAPSCPGRLSQRKVRIALKITGVETYVVNAYRTNWVFVRVLTDEGIYGVGEGTLEHRELTVETAIREYGEDLIGQDPFQIEKHIALMTRDTYWRWGPVLSTAMSALEGALWDIKGKALGVPVYELLGGLARDRIPVYAN